MILSASIVYVNDQPVLLCQVGTVKQEPMPSLEQAFQSYEAQRQTGTHVVLLRAASTIDAVFAIRRFDLIRRFGTNAVYMKKAHGFRVITARKGGPYKHDHVIHRDELSAAPTPATGGAR